MPLRWRAAVRVAYDHIGRPMREPEIADRLYAAGIEEARALWIAPILRRLRHDNQIIFRRLVTDRWAHRGKEIGFLTFTDRGLLTDGLQRDLIGVMKSGGCAPPSLLAGLLRLSESQERYDKEMLKLTGWRESAMRLAAIGLE